MIELAFALIILASWSISDAKTGLVHNFTLALPVILALLFWPSMIITYFVPMFVTLTAIYMVLKRRGLIGFADIVAIPFTLSFVLAMGLYGIMVFVGLFSFLVLVVTGSHFDKKLGKKVRNNIILIPVLFLSYFVGFLVHLIFSLF